MKRSAPSSTGGSTSKKRPHVEIENSDEESSSAAVKTTIPSASAASSSPTSGAPAASAAEALSVEPIEKGKLLQDAQTSVLSVVRSKAGPTGISADDLVKSTKYSLQVVSDAVNELLRSGELVVLDKDVPLFGAQSSEEAAKLRGLSPEERLVYQLIEEAGNTGIWIKHIKTRSNIAATRIPKILSTLEKRKMVKAVKTADAGKKKVYMLYSLEPPHKADFSPERVAMYTERVLNYLRVRSARVEDITFHLRSLQDEMPARSSNDLSARTDLTPADVLQLMQMLVCDRRVEETVYSSQAAGQRHARPQIMYGLSRLATAENYPTSGYCNTPCSRCPVFDKCSIEGDISPLTCEYFAQWYLETDDQDEVDQ